MSDDVGVGGRLLESRGVAGVLAAAYEAFEYMLSVIAEYQDPAGEVFAAFVMAAASAADGRDAVGFAPSFPPPGLAAPAAVAPGRRSAGEAADDLADLSQLLAAKLVQAARSAHDRGDQAACAQAAEHARTIWALLAGAGP